MFESANDFAVFSGILLVGMYAAVAASRLLSVGMFRISLLFVWHLIFCIAYYNYVLSFGGDVLSYYISAKIGYIDFGIGTKFIIILVYPMVSLGFSMLSCSLVFSLLGFFGIIFFYGSLIERPFFGKLRGFWKEFIYLLMFLPSMSFWSSGLGKDSLAMLAVGLFLWGSRNFNARWLLLGLSIALMFAVRPHIGGIMMLSVGLGILFSPGVSRFLRMAIGGTALAGVTVVIPAALFYAIGSTSFSDIDDFVGSFQEKNMGGGSSIDIVSMNPILRFVSYMYRPFINEVNGFSQFVSAIDNAIIMLISVFGIIGVFSKGGYRTAKDNAILLLYLVPSMILLSQVTANLGIASRQKWMLIPVLISFCLDAFFSAAQQRSAERQQAEAIRGLSARHRINGGN